MTTSIKYFCDFCGIKIPLKHKHIHIETIDENFKYNIFKTEDACDECYRIKLGQLKEIMFK